MNCGFCLVIFLGVIIMSFQFAKFVGDPKGELLSLRYAKKSELLLVAQEYSLPVEPTYVKARLVGDILNHLIDQNIVQEDDEDVEELQYITGAVAGLKVDSELEMLKLQIASAEQQRIKTESAERAMRLQFELNEQQEKMAEQEVRRQLEIADYKLRMQKEIAELELKKQKELREMEEAAAELELKKQKEIEESEIRKQKEIEESEIRKQKEIAELELKKQRELADIEVEKLNRTASIHLQTKTEEGNLPDKFSLVKAQKLIPNFDEHEPEVFFSSFEDTANTLKWPKDQWVMLIRNNFRGKAALISSQLVTNKDYDTLKKAILDGYSITIEGYRQQFRKSYKESFQTFVEFCNIKVRQFQKWLDKAGVQDLQSLKDLLVMEEFLRKMPLNIATYIMEKGETNLLKAASLADDYFLIHKSYKSSIKTSYSTDKYCAYCKLTGHTIESCKHPHCKKSEVKQFTKAREPKKTLHVSKPTPDLECFTPFTCQGFINGQPVTCLRDTGSNQTVAHLPTKDLKWKEEYVPISDLTGTQTLPLAEVDLDCQYFKGKVPIAISGKPLPCSSFQVIIGNDLAGANVNNLVVSNPKSISKDNQLSNNFVAQVINVNKSEKVNQSRMEKAIELVNIEKSKFVDLVAKDSNLKSCWKKIANPADHPKTPYFYTDNNLLFRHYRSPKAPTDVTWYDCQQLVLPTSLTQPLLDLAHSSESHLGINKTYSRLSQDFYWPGMKRDIKTFISKCHTCQVTGRPNESIPRAPLQPIAVPKMPFEKVIIDCVGPLTKTKKGNEYLLTVMCPTTRYPIALPIKTIHAKTILSQLMKVFTTFGFPKVLQCDRGTNFTSNLFKQAMQELNIHNVYATAYHPQSNGALERAHQTIKNLLRKYLQETSLPWDEDLDLLMYILRSVPHDATGVSPFELMFGRKPRTTLGMVKENLISNKAENPVNLLAYIKDLKEKFTSMYAFANENLKLAQERMSHQYDKKTKVRNFQIGEQVLVYHPIPGAPLREKFSGPYSILKRTSKVNYVISTPDRRRPTQLVHVNLIKPYSAPPQVVSNILALPTDTSTTCNQHEIKDRISEDNLVSWKDLTNEQVLKSLPQYFAQLEPFQQKSLSKLLTNYSDVCTDKLKGIKTLEHNILLEPGTTPIRQPFYRIVGKRLEALKKEVQYLLDNNLAEPSTSPWASPCILVPKANGQLRLCTDYRKLNKVTVKDSFPLPRINDILDSVGNAKILTQLDLLKGYYQVPLSREAKEISAFTTPFGLFAYKVLPFGLTNSPATFQRIMTNIIKDLPGTHVYLDDIVVASEDFKQHLGTLQKLFERFRETNITINLAKSTFATAEVTYLGHRIGNGQISPKEANILSIKTYPTPTGKKELRTFLGMVTYYSRFIRNFSNVTAPLFSLTSSKVKFSWSPEHQKIFNDLKSILVSKPILKAPDFNHDFCLQVDASSTGYGAVLMQTFDGSPPETATLDHLLPIAYHSGHFKGAQTRWATIEKELYSLITALQHFAVYLEGHPKIILFTDHQPLLHLDRSRLQNHKMLRWSYILTRFHVELHRIRGSDNKLADALSRIPTSTSHTMTNK